MAKVRHTPLGNRISYLLVLQLCQYVEYNQSYRAPTSVAYGQTWPAVVSSRRRPCTGRLVCIIACSIRREMRGFVLICTYYISMNRKLNVLLGGIMFKSKKCGYSANIHFFQIQARNIFALLIKKFWFSISAFQNKLSSQSNNTNGIKTSQFWPF